MVLVRVGGVVSMRTEANGMRRGDLIVLTDVDEPLHQDCRISGINFRVANDIKSGLEG